MPGCPPLEPAPEPLLPSPYWGEEAIWDSHTGTLVRSFRGHSQIIMVTHQKRSMEIADVMYGITMGPDAVTKVVSERGKVDAAFPNAPVRIDAQYGIAAETHNPIETHATVAVWDGDTWGTTTLGTTTGAGNSFPGIAAVRAATDPTIPNNGGCFRPIRLTAIYSSPLERCVETVEPLAGAQRLASGAEVDLVTHDVRKFFRLLLREPGVLVGLRGQEKAGAVPAPLPSLGCGGGGAGSKRRRPDLHLELGQKP